MLSTAVLEGADQGDWYSVFTHLFLASKYFFASQKKLQTHPLMQIEM